jgi:predicted dehydrogenase
MNAQTNCTIAVIGAGYMAREHIRAFQDIPGVKIAGTFSRTRTRAEVLAGEFNIPMVCDSVDELYEKTHADLVIVAVPELAANTVSRACFQYPWTCLLEKPAGYNFSDAQEIEAAARARHSSAYVALNRRFYSSTQQVLADLKNIDMPRFIHVQDQEDPKRALQAGRPQAVVDNWMYANSIHLVDYFTLLGRGRVAAVEPIIPWNPSAPWIVAAKIQFDSGDVGLYQGIWDGPGPWAVSINTAAKRWEMRPVEQAAYQLAGQRTLEPVQINPWDQQFKPGLRLMAEKAIAASQGAVTDLPTLAEALQSMTLVKEIFGR